MDSANQLTVLLKRLATGDSSAEHEVLPLVYDELRVLASLRLRRERPGHSLQPTALVHEAYLRMAGRAGGWNSRAHFFCIAARAMRQVLVDHARRRKAGKRGYGGVAIEMGDDIRVTDQRVDLILGVDQALHRLSDRDARQARIVEMRFFSGLTEEEIALLLGISARTVKRDWLVAKAWLHAELNPDNFSAGARAAHA
jgi:RNA polymerase sigma factor (TIGR02999 family)